MNRPLFFSDVVFAWTFCAMLIALTSIAAWTDTRKAKIPNRLTVSILALGLLVSVLRGGFLAANDMPVWWLWKYNPGAVWLGAIDGLLFAVTGFIVAFGVMFLVWMFGGCGGGDAKLFGAIGAWIGFSLFPMLWIASVAFLLVWTLARVLSGGLSPKQVQKTLTTLKQPHADHNAGRPPTLTPGKLRVTYSLPIAVATAVVLLWVFRVELQLAPPKPQQGASAHDRLSPPVA